MLRMLLHCDGCNYEEKVEDIYNLDGFCHNCHEHHGEVQYFSEMTSEEFIDELANMSEKEIAKAAAAIKYCAEDIIEEGL